MAADERLSDVLAFLRDYTRDEADAARAAMTEPDDDRYLELRDRFTAHCGEGVSPVVDRLAVPGGRTDDTDPEAGDRIRPRVVLAVASGTARGRRAWEAYVASMRSAKGASIDQALSIAEVGGRLMVLGRRAANPFVDDLEWEDAGGAPFELDRVDDVRIQQLPLDSQHAQFLRHLARG